MFLFTHVTKHGATVHRQRHAFLLEQSLSELFTLYARMGGAGEAVRAALDARIDRALGEVSRSKADLQDYLYVLLRAKDLHRFATREPALGDVTLRFLETVLMHRDPPARWAALRELLSESAERLCGNATPGMPGALERIKREMTHPASHLGTLLRASALFNFDCDEEVPPPNLRIRFAGGHFPDHSWESVDGAALPAGHTAVGGWSPANPLCRWEYLATDLAHELYRRREGERRLAGERPWERTAGQGAVGAPASDVYRAAPAADAGGTQLEMLPVQPAALVQELARHAHGAHGGEGTWLFARLMDLLSRGTPATVLPLSLEKVAKEGGGAGATPARVRERARKAWKLLNGLCEVELMRIGGPTEAPTVHRSRLVTLLGEVSPAEKSGGLPSAPSREAPPGEVRVLVDSYFHDAPGGGLAWPYRDLPAPLVGLPPREHPFALGLFARLRQGWADAEGDGAPVTLSARRLLEEAGIAVKESGRYRAVETLKRELSHLRDMGLLGGWRLQRGTTRDMLDDTYVLRAPPADGAAQPAGTSGAGQATALAMP